VAQTINAQQLRDIRTWAVEVVLGSNSSANHALATAGQPVLGTEIDQVILDAKLLAAFVLGE
jgi:hypothetical protein